MRIKITSASGYMDEYFDIIRQYNAELNEDSDWVYSCVYISLGSMTELLALKQALDKPILITEEDGEITLEIIDRYTVVT